MARKQARNRGRFTKRNQNRRRRKPATSLIAVGTQLAVADAISRGLFNVGLPTFLGISDNFAGGYSSKNDSNEVTARELLSIATGGGGGIYAKSFPTGIQGVLASNFKRNGFGMMVQVIGIPVGVKLAKKFLAKPIINPANKMLRTVGIKEVKI